MPRPVHLFLPVFQDVPSFLHLRQGILKALSPAFEVHFHLIDDSAGEDPEPQKLALADTDVLVPPWQLGHQGALVLGLREKLPAVPDDAIVVTMDADGEDRPEDLPCLLAEYLAHEDERPLVLARRTTREEGKLFKLMYFFYRHAFRALTGTVIRSGNFAVMHPRSAEAWIHHPYFELAYASTLVALGNPRYVPCPRGRRYAGQSRMSYPRLIAHGVRMLLPFSDRIAVRGAKAFAALSVVSAVAFALLAVSRRAPEWAVVGALATIVGAVLTLCQFAVLRVVLARVGRIGPGVPVRQAPKMGRAGIPRART